jgi:dipeptidyl aminopeptidase/acylaminoacyl peptidase
VSETATRKPGHPRTRILRLLTAIALVLAAIVLLIRLTGVAESLAYFPSRQPFTTPPAYQDVWFESADGVRLHAWFMPAVATPGEPFTSGPGPAILHCHGNAGTLANHRSFSEFLTREGFHVLIFDYRGYGRSDDDGPLRRDKLLLDTQAAFEALLARPEVDPARVGAMGVSLGGAFASTLTAQDERVRALTLVSAFSSWKGVAKDWMPILGPILFKRGLDPEKQVAGLESRPLLIVQGDADEVINVRHADRLLSAATDAGVPVEIRVVPGGDHNTLIQSDPDTQAAIAEFFRRKLKATEHD